MLPLRSNRLWRRLLRRSRRAWIRGKRGFGFGWRGLEGLVWGCRAAFGSRRWLWVGGLGSWNRRSGVAVVASRLGVGKNWRRLCRICRTMKVIVCMRLMRRFTFFIQCTFSTTLLEQHLKLSVKKLILWQHDRHSLLSSYCLHSLL